MHIMSSVSESSSSLATAEYADIGGIQVQLNYQHRLDAVNRSTHPDPFLLADELKRLTTNQTEIKENEPASTSLSFSSSAISFKHHTIYGPSSQFSLTFHHGPRLTSAYHTQPYEEWYYVIDGSILLYLIDAGEFKSMTLNKGDCYLVGANIPKSVQQTAHTQLLIMSLQRHYHEQSSQSIEHALQDQDEYVWFCHQCAQPLFSYKFKTNDQGQWTANSALHHH
jgi:mannose-6-phosphate isomerase-like protein (cupin superfamily)